MEVNNTILQEIKNELGESFDNYFAYLKSFITCQISQEEYLDYLKELQQTHQNIFDLNDKLLLSFVTKNEATNA